MKNATASANRELDEILDLIGVSVQLTAPQFERAETSYHAVARWLQDPASEVRDFRPDIFPQGSLRLDTTVRPMRHTEFDLDLVCLVQLSPWRAAPDAVYDLLLRRMRAHGTYDKIIVEMPRCIRLDYSGDFHLDIVPAVPDPAGPSGSSHIRIPDRAKKTWLGSNPKGFSNWFIDRTKVRKAAEGVRRFSVNAGVEPLRVPASAAAKPPLTLSVQLFKRWRDVVFAGREHLAPSSIVLTTLSGMFYGGEDHPSDALAAILDGIHHWSLREEIVLYNPSNPGECITDRWRDREDMYDAFIDAVRAFRGAMHGMIDEGRYPDLVGDLKAMFGDWPVARAVTAFAERRKLASGTGGLLMNKSTGVLGLAASPRAALSAGDIRVKGHTFHGE